MMETVQMTEEQVYLFDLQGFIVLKSVVPLKTIASANKVLEKLEQLSPDEWPHPLFPGGNLSQANIYIGNILEADQCIVSFIDIPEILGVIERISGGPYRLNHTFAICRWEDGYTDVHLGGSPLRHNLQFRCENGIFFSTHTTAAVPLLPCGPEDGCFAAMPASHKSNFPRPWGKHPDENPALVPVVAEPGDAIVFTEALTHGSMVNHSGRRRRTLYFGYTIGWMTIFGGDGMQFTDKLRDWLSDDQFELISVKSADGQVLDPSV